MSNCISFSQAFEDNMNAIGLSVPQNLFDSYDKAVTTLAHLTAAAQLNPATPAAAVLGAEGATAGLFGLAACGAAFYAGAVTGSIMVATSNNLACAMSSKILTVASVQSFLIQNGIYDSGVIITEIYANPRFLIRA